MTRTSILVHALLFVLVGSYQWQGIGCMYGATNSRIYTIISVIVCSMLCIIVCCLSVSTLPELTPSTVLSACPGDKVVINCHESDTTAIMEISLRWEITPMNNLFAVIELALTDMVNDTERQDLGLKFHAEWISHTPRSAMLTITADLILDGATVTCASSGSAISDPLTVRVTQIGNNIINKSFM